jgi:hypothetical protein
MYESPMLDPDLSPESLENKVLWDILYYFARRGAENLQKMNRDFFKVK